MYTVVLKSVPVTLAGYIVILCADCCTERWSVLLDGLMRCLLLLNIYARKIYEKW